MKIRRLPADEEAVRRYTEELWLPYHRDLEAAVDDHTLVDDVDDRLAEEVEFRLGLLEAESYRLWVAVDDIRGEEDAPLAEIDGDLVGFIATNLDECPSVFDRPDRLLVGDIYVRDAYRGTGLAQELIDRAATRARDEGCSELTLEVAADNERAIAFYRKLGLETRRHQMIGAVDEL